MDCTSLEARIAYPRVLPSYDPETTMAHFAPIPFMHGGKRSLHHHIDIGP